MEGVNGERSGRLEKEKLGVGAGGKGIFYFQFTIESCARGVREPEDRRRRTEDRRQRTEDGKENVEYPGKKWIPASAGMTRKKEGRCQQLTNYK